MAIFGYNSIGSGNDGGSVANEKHGTIFTLSENATITKISIYGWAGSGTANTKAVIYATSGTTPGAKQGADSPAVSVSTTPAWRDYVFASPINLVAGTYTLAEINDADYYIAYTSGTSNQSPHNTDAYSNGASDPFGTLDDADNIQFSIYATYYITPTKTFTLNAELQSGSATYTKTFTADASLLKNLTKAFTINSELLSPFTKAFTLNASLLKNLTKTLTINAELQSSSFWDWQDEFNNQNARWNWSYYAGSGYHICPTTKDDYTVSEHGILSGSSAYSDCALGEYYIDLVNHSIVIVEGKFKFSDSGASPAVGSKGFGFWDYQSWNSVAWFWVGSPAHTSEWQGLRAQVVNSHDTFAFNQAINDVDITQWHVYRIEISDAGTVFKIDDNVVASTSERPANYNSWELISWVDNGIWSFSGETPATTVEDEKMWMDYVYFHQAFGKTFTFNADLLSSLSKGFTLNADLLKSLTKGFTVGADLQAGFAKGFTINAELQAAFSKGFTVNAELEQTLTKTFTVNTDLQLPTFTKTFTVDAELLKNLTATFTAGADLIPFGTVGFTVNADLELPLSPSGGGFARIGKLALPFIGLTDKGEMILIFPIKLEKEK